MLVLTQLLRRNKRHGADSAYVEMSVGMLVPVVLKQILDELNVYSLLRLTALSPDSVMNAFGGLPAAIHTGHLNSLIRRPCTFDICFY